MGERPALHLPLAGHQTRAILLVVRQVHPVRRQKDESHWREDGDSR